jgi:hypothetical protein
MPYNSSYYEKNKEALREYQRNYYYKKKLKSDVVKPVKVQKILNGLQRYYYPIIINFD